MGRCLAVEERTDHSELIPRFHKTSRASLIFLRSSRSGGYVPQRIRPRLNSLLTQRYLALAEMAQRTNLPCCLQNHGTVS